MSTPNSSKEKNKKQRTLLSFFQPNSSSPAKRPNRSPNPSSDQTLLGPSSSAKQVTSQEPLSTDPKPTALNDMPSSPPRGPLKSLNARRNRKPVIMDSDSDSNHENDDDEGSDWEPTAKNVQDEEEDLKTEHELLFDEDKSETKPRQTKRKSPPKPNDPPSLPNSSKLVTPTSEFEWTADPNASLSKYAISSDYTASEATRPPKPKKVKIDIDSERYDWLKNVKDKQGRLESDPLYDPRTILVPQYAWAKFTPFEKQYWEIKQNLWNTVVFFKKGKFYELYENDAHIGHTEFDLKLAGGGRANMSLCGVPEMSFDNYASAFIAKGYKVAKVDQAETALGKEMRDIQNKKKEEKIIKREMKCVLTAGTLTYGGILTNDLSQYCMAIKQDGLNFAACFVDAAVGQFFITEFCDISSDYPMLETLFAQTRPRELVIQKHNLDKYALKIIRSHTSTNTIWEIVDPGTEFPDANTARRAIEFGEYFENDSVPVTLQQCMESDLTASSVGALVHYLKTLLLDRELLGLGSFIIYDVLTTNQGSAMLLDGQTLHNLEVFANTWDGGSEGTLFSLVNKCLTPFGKRQLKDWLARPLQLREAITRRADVVDIFIMQDEVRDAIVQKLSGLPDIDRMLARTHAGGLKPQDFFRLLQGLKTVSHLLKWISEIADEHLPQLKPFLHDPQPLTEAIEPWLNAFDAAAANRGELIPSKGVYLEFDAASEQVSACEQALHEELKNIRAELKINALEFRDSGKEIFLVEAPIKYRNQIPKDWIEMGGTSKFKRYYPKKIQSMVRELQEAKEIYNNAAQNCQQILYAKFTNTRDYKIYTDATKSTGTLDCLLSLALTSMRMANHCRPELVDGDAFVEFKELRHPVATTGDFIPNDIFLGNNEARISLLTGANAAGKSTLLRTTAASVLLAQIGCHVPAKEAKLAPIDRIMTRLGASDSIFAGKSTFHVELSETARVLNEATNRTLVVLDELGRGGSSSDGYAIAESVLYHLATHTQCLGFFATHYANLYDPFECHPQVKPERMAILELENEIAFTYKLESGRSAGSFGMHVAKMCGVPLAVIQEAEKAASEREHTAKLERRKTELSTAVPLGLISDTVYGLHNSIKDSALDIMLSEIGYN